MRRTKQTISYGLKQRKQRHELVLYLSEPKGRNRLHSVADVLNARPPYMRVEDHQELVRWVDFWKGADRDWARLRQQRKGSPTSLEHNLNIAVRFEIVLLEPPPPHCGAHLMPVSAAKSRYVANDVKKTIQLRNIGAFEWLAYLLTYEQIDFWGGRCDRCKRFYVKNSLRQKRYCSPSCGANQTSKESKIRTASVAKNAKLEKVRGEIQTYWNSSATNKGADKCRAHVMKEVAELTNSWITRQVNNGLLDLSGRNALPPR